MMKPSFTLKEMSWWLCSRLCQSLEYFWAPSLSSNIQNFAE